MRFIVMVFLCAGLAMSCTTVTAYHGYSVELGETELDAKPGIDSKDSVIARYGEPSLRPAVNQDVWYYVSSKTSARAFFRTKTDERRVVAFNFGPDGKVLSVDKYGIENGKVINLVNRVTPTKGRELSFMEQLLGTVGQLPTTTEESPN